MQNRRTFLKQASLMLAGGVIAPQFLTACAGKAASDKKQIGLQLYSLREMVKDQGIQPVLEAVAKMGYTAVETADYNDGKVYGLAPAEFKKRVEDLGMKCTSAHVSPSYTREQDAEKMAWWDKCIATYNEIGVKYLVQAYAPLNERSTMDTLNMYCEYFNKVGLNTAASSITFCYHNHSFEFGSIDGHQIYNYLLENTSPNHVFFEQDVYWAQVGGANPVELMKTHPNRFKCIHIKDEKEIGASGKMDFQAIFDQMKINKIKDWYVEVEQYTNNDPVASVQQSYDFLASAPYVY